MKSKEDHFKARIADLESRLRELNTIGMMLSSEKDLHRLLEMILQKAREITQSDSGSIYLIDREEVEGQELEGPHEEIERLRFMLAQNDTVDLSLQEFTLPINNKSIVGYVALTRRNLIIDNVYELDDTAEFSHNRRFDEESGYITRSMMVVPMQDHRGELFGVLQLINKLKSGGNDAKAEITTYDRNDQELVESLASQASVSIANAKLYDDIQKLFEGFVRASVLAIESRDPTTSGHSERVATLTCGLAELVDKKTDGVFSHYSFDRNDLQEIRYAALLHDFGKIGVREEVLVKAKKLHPMETELLRYRFAFMRKCIEHEMSQQKVEYLIQQDRDKALEHIAMVDKEAAYRFEELDRYLESILNANEPTILEEGAFDFLREIHQQEFTDIDGQARPLISEYELDQLSVRKGSLSAEERKAIESHVTHSYHFLKKIPWTKTLRRVPSIAYAHHEKLDGSGYPRQLSSSTIPFQAKIMTIADIFDALTAQDRPYKRAVPVKRALEILEIEVNAGQLDRNLFELFTEGKVFTKVTGSADD